MFYWASAKDNNVQDICVFLHSFQINNSPKKQTNIVITHYDILAYLQIVESGFLLLLHFALHLFILSLLHILNMVMSCVVNILLRTKK